MADEPVDLTTADLVKRVLEAEGMTAEQALVTLLDTMMQDWTDAQQREEAGLDSVDHGDALGAVQWALAAQYRQHQDEYEQNADEGMENDESIDDDDFMDGLVGGSIADAQDSLIELVSACEAMARRDLEIAEYDKKVMADLAKEAGKTPPGEFPPLRIAG